MTGEEKYQRAKIAILDSLQGTQAEIAAAIGVSQPYYHEIRTGKKQPSPDVLDRLAELAGMELVIDAKKKKRKNS